MTTPYYGIDIKDKLVGNILLTDQAATITEPWVFSKPIIMGDTLSVSGTTTLTGSLSAKGATFANAVTFSNNTTTTGTTTLNGTLTANSTSTFNDNVSIATNKTLTVGGATTINNTLKVTNATTLTNTLTVQSTSSFQNNVTISDNKTLTVGGNATVKGILYANNGIEVASGKNIKLVSGSLYVGNTQAIDTSGVAYRAKYADYAELYVSDKEYSPGTIVSIGGEKEITLATDKDKVFGVISTTPAFVCNNYENNSEIITLPVCCVGRIPCLVNGIVKKGDKITFAKDGIARAFNDNDIINHNVIIGIALRDKTTEETGLVEIVSRINF